jgi:hypothetical protein
VTDSPEENVFTDEAREAVLAAVEQFDALRRRVAELETENDNYHADLIRVIGERNAAAAKVDAVEALHRADLSAASAHGIHRIACPECGEPWPCPTYRAVAGQT